MKNAGDRYFDGAYLAHNPSWHAEHSPTKARWIDDILTRNRLEPATVAEVGCGSGEILVELKKRRPDARFTGFEVSPQAYGICSARQSPGLDFRLADLVEGLHLDLEGQAGAGRPGRLHGPAQAARGLDVVVLDQQRVVQAHAVVGPAAAAHGVLLQVAQARGGLAGVADHRPGAGHGLDVGVAPGEQGDPLRRPVRPGGAPSGCPSLDPSDG